MIPLDDSCVITKLTFLETRRQSRMPGTTPGIRPLATNWVSYAACERPALLVIVHTGVAAGPDCARGLNQNAVIQILVPGSTDSGMMNVYLVRVVLPTNSQPLGPGGGFSPTARSTVAPATPSGLPRVSESAVTLMRTVT